MVLFASALIGSIKLILLLLLLCLLLLLSPLCLKYTAQVDFRTTGPVSQAFKRVVSMLDPEIRVGPEGLLSPARQWPSWKARTQDTDTEVIENDINPINCKINNITQILRGSCLLRISCRQQLFESVDRSQPEQNEYHKNIDLNNIGPQLIAIAPQTFKISCPNFDYVKTCGLRFPALWIDLLLLQHLYSRV